MMDAELRGERGVVRHVRCGLEALIPHCPGLAAVLRHPDPADRDPDQQPVGLTRPGTDRVQAQPARTRVTNLGGTARPTGRERAPTSRRHRASGKSAAGSTPAHTSPAPFARSDHPTPVRRPRRRRQETPGRSTLATCPPGRLRDGCAARSGGRPAAARTVPVRRSRTAYSTGVPTNVPFGHGQLCSGGLPDNTTKPFFVPTNSSTWPEPPEMLVITIT